MANFCVKHMKKEEKIDSFSTVRFKIETAKRFREFSRKHFKSHSEAMATMLDFFLYNEISPKEKLGPTGRTMENSLKKRLNAIIAIIKDVEKNQSKPMLGMLQSLFEETEPKKKPLILEKKVERKEESYHRSPINDTNTKKDQ